MTIGIFLRWPLISSFLFLFVAANLAQSQVPTIASFAPSSGATGSTVLITGTNFSATPSNNIVNFGVVNAVVNLASTTQLSVTVPVSASYAPISVTVAGLSAYSAAPFVPTFPGTATITSASFSPKVDFLTGNVPYEIAVSDADGDGKPDIIVGNYNDKTVSVFRNTSTADSLTAGSFAASVDFATFGNPWGIAVGDLDGDGKPDIVVSNGTAATISVFRNASVSGTITSGSFASRVDFSIGGSGYGVAISDVDGDGKRDIIATNRNANTVSVLRNTSSIGSITGSSFAASVDFTTGSTPYGVAITDVDGDGKPDMVVANSVSGTLSIFRNTSSSGSITLGSFAAKVDFTPSGNPIGVVLGDLDGDGKPDMVCVNTSDSTLSIFRNTSSSGSITGGSFAPEVDFKLGGSPNSIALGDLNGDGKPDIVVANGNNNTVSVFRNVATAGAITVGSFAPRVDFAATNVPYGIALGDLDGDGKTDLAATNNNGNTVSLLRSVVGVPLAVQNLAAVPGNGRVLLKWSRSHESDFLLYRIYGGASANPAAKIDSATGGIDDTTKIIAGLTNGTKYYFRITAVDSVGNESAFSNELNATPGQGTLAVIPSLSFGILLKGDSATLSFKARNTSTNLVTITGASLSTSIFTCFLTTPVTITGGDSVTVSVRFKALTFGTFIDTLVLTSDGGVGRIALSARGYNRPGRPVASAVAPSAWSNAASFTITWSTNQSGMLPVTKIWYAIDTLPRNAAGLLSQSAGPTGAAIAMTKVGKDTVYFFLEDSLGNKNQDSIGSVIIKFDNIIPVLTQNNAALGTILVQSDGTLSSIPAIVASGTEAANQSGMAGLKLLYRRLDEQAWTTIDFPGFSDSSLTIPSGSFIKNRTVVGAEYRIQATDSAGNSTFSNLLSFDIRYSADLAVPNFADIPSIHSLTLPTGQEVKAYRIFSIPYDPENEKPGSFVEQSFGPHADQGVPYVNWRMARIVNGAWQDYDAFKNSPVVIPGSGFFIVSKDHGKSASITKPTLIRSDKMLYTGITLNQGWNLVGNPFLVNVPFDHMIFEGGRHLAHYYYSGTGSQGGWEGSGANFDTLRTWQGIAVKVDSAATLRFNLVGLPWPPTAGQSNVRNIDPAAPTGSRRLKGWTLSFDAARIDLGMSCTGTEIGMKPGASRGYDNSDRVQAPFVGDRNLLVSLRSDAGPLVRDMRSPNNDGDSWDISVTTGDAFAKAVVTFGSLDEISNQSFEACFIDSAKGLAYDLSKERIVQVTAGKEGVGEYRLIVGTKEFVEKSLKGIALVPTEPQLYLNFPNPFNPETIIRYAVPNAMPRARVLLKVYSLLGQEVRTLVNDDRTPGFYEVSFDGKGLSSGPYFYHISISADAVTYRSTQKMMLLK